MGITEPAEVTTPLDPCEQTLPDQLKLTIEWAVARSTFYRDLFRHSDPRIETIEDFFAQVPIVDKASVASRVDEFVDLEEIPAAISVTSGTTSSQDSQPLLIFSSDLQLEYYGRLTKSLQASGSNIKRRLRLNITNGSHGISTTPRIPGLFMLPLRKQSHFHAIVHLLRREFIFEGSEPRISQFSGSLYLIQLLTLLLKESGIPSSDFAISNLAVSSIYLSPRWRNLLEDYWQCPVLELYGLSEIPMFNCARASTETRYSFQGPVFLEVMDLDLRHHISSGVGRLIATPLLPFACAQPILRYDTGDLVQVSDWNLVSPERLFELHGRASQSFISDFGRGAELVLSATEAQSVLSSVADVNVEPYPETAFLQLKTRCGWPVYRGQLTDGKDRKLLQLDVELRYSPFEFPEREATFRSELTTALRNKSPSLNSLIEDRQLELEIICHVADSLGNGVVV